MEQQRGVGLQDKSATGEAFRTGCKVVVLDRQGSLLEHTAIFPHPPVTDVHTANRVIRDLAKKYGVEAIAIGNGTAGRETEQFVRHVDFETMPLIVTVNENGASVYSASELARQEFPDEDITVRGAVSIGRRLMDPLAELIKIDPKSIGVGQYQHDVNQKKLAASLDETVSSCVDAVFIRSGKDMVNVFLRKGLPILSQLLVGCLLCCSLQAANGFPCGYINRISWRTSSSSPATFYLNRGYFKPCAEQIMNNNSAIANVAAKATLDKSTRELKVTTQVCFTSAPKDTTVPFIMNVALVQNNIKGPQVGAATWYPERWDGTNRT